jgi:hypothetical protein
VGGTTTPRYRRRRATQRVAGGHYPGRPPVTDPDQHGSGGRPHQSRPPDTRLPGSTTRQHPASASLDPGWDATLPEARRTCAPRPMRGVEANGGGTSTPLRHMRLTPHTRTAHPLASLRRGRQPRRGRPAPPPPNQIGFRGPGRCPLPTSGLTQPRRGSPRVVGCGGARWERESAGGVPSSGSQGLGGCSGRVAALSRVVLLLVSWGKVSRGSGGETSPPARCLPVWFPTGVVTFSAALGESVRDGSPPTPGAPTVPGGFTGCQPPLRMTT